MKRWLKKVNRGLLLAAVLVIGTAIYVVIDNKNFKSEKPLIEQTITDYVEELAEINVTPEKYREYGKKYSKEDAEKRESEFVEFTDKYWISDDHASQNIMYSWGMLRDDFVGDMKRVMQDERPGFITDFSAKVSQCKVSKDGPNAAVLTCNVKLYYVAASGTPIIAVGSIDYPIGWHDGSDMDEAGKNYYMEQVSVEQECTFNLVKKSDGWKIVMCQFYDTNSSSAIIDDTEEIE